MDQLGTGENTQERLKQGNLVVLADASSRVELDLIKDWVAQNSADAELVRLAPSRRRKRGQRTEAGLEDRIRRGDDPFLVPVRVVWSPSARSGDRRVSWWDVLKLGDPRDPDALRQRVIRARWPDRISVIAGEGASASQLQAEHAASTLPLDQFVTRRAWRALDRAERSLRGNRYKVPKFLHEEITGNPSFEEGARLHGAERGLNPTVSVVRARYYLREIAASHSPFVIDLVANAINWIIKQGYGAIVYDRDRVHELSAIGRELPLAFLPAHRSNLDRLSLQFVKWENDLPPNHTAGGINMNFFPVGPLVRRTGVFFIRRTFKDNPLYKFVLKEYIDYLVEKRFPLEWYMEGGRSRSGKLLPPKYGILSYVVDAWKSGKSEDVMLVPVSIVYDQIQDLGSYTEEAQGGTKQGESLGWALGVLRSLRRRYGNIHIRFGEPVSVAKAMSVSDPEDDTHDLAKLGLEVMHRVAAVTPISRAAVVSIALLMSEGKARSLVELVESCRAIYGLITDLRLPTTEAMNLDSENAVELVVRMLHDHGNVSLHGGGEHLFYLTPDQALRAGYYRNIVAHHFLHRAILEMALDDQGRRLDEGRLWQRIGELRDLLKFEFFFPEKEEFLNMISADLDAIKPDWRESTPQALVKLMQPKTASWVTRPFLQSYLVVADELVATPGPVGDEKAFVRSCLRRGESYRLRGIIEADGVSTIIFRQALALASNRDLLGENTERGRERLAAEIRRAIKVS